jgi:hypothetical protein
MHDVRALGPTLVRDLDLGSQINIEVKVWMP